MVGAGGKVERGVAQLVLIIIIIVIIMIAAIMIQIMVLIIMRIIMIMIIMLNTVVFQGAHNNNYDVVMIKKSPPSDLGRPHVEAIFQQPRSIPRS